MTIPTGNELDNSTTIYYRIRATDANHTVGQWETGYFHLPGHSVSQNGNYGTISFDYNDLGLSEETFEDTFIDSRSNKRNDNMGSEFNFTVGTSSNSEQYGLIRLNLDDVGLHSNSSIISANLSLERVSFNGDAEISIHAFYGEDWTESSATWRKYDGTNNWDNGGRTPSMSVGSFDANQTSSNFKIDLTAIIQKWIDDNNVARSLGIQQQLNLT